MDFRELDALKCKMDQFRPLTKGKLKQLNAKKRLNMFGLLMRSKVVLWTNMRQQHLRNRCYDACYTCQRNFRNA